MVAPAAVGAVLICFCCVVAVFMSKIKRLNQEKLAALEAKAAELEDKHRAAEARVSSILTDQEQQSMRRMSVPQRQETVDRHLHRLASTVTFGLVAPPNDEESPEAFQPDWASKPRAAGQSSSRRGGGGRQS